jgi:hypothetical protein
MEFKYNLSLILVLCVGLFLTSSCLSSTSYKCEEVDISETYYLDSIDSGLETDDGIYAASIILKGFLENDIQFNNMSLASGTIDTVINHQDQYGTQYYIVINNELGGVVHLDICVSFSH